MTIRAAYFLVLFLATAAFYNSGALARQDPGEKYTSPLRNFSITVPSYPLGTKVEESNDKIHGWVGFKGGAGDAARIGYQRLDPPPSVGNPDSLIALSRAALAGLDSLSRAMLRNIVAGLDSLSRDSLLTHIVQQLPRTNIDIAHQRPPAPDSIIIELAALLYGFIANVQQQLMAHYDARLISREPVVLDSTLMVFTVAVSPEGSENVDMATGKHLDVGFGHLVFIKGGFLYNLFVQPNGFAAAMAPKDPNAPNGVVQTARRLVQTLYRSIAFQ
ncbi:MAG: hypothetical protein HYR76_01430 [Ignavibacteria bacterium]|nr:hypothetical protein [Ignavibacteria bacterium]MBI3766650.1 hypothetical protein [Ignavibacteriales bacterium]